MQRWFCIPAGAAEMEWPMKMTETEKMIGLRMKEVTFRKRRWRKPVLAGAVVIWLVLVILLCSVFFGKRSGEYTTDITCVSSYHEIYRYFSGLLEKQDRYMLEDGGNLSALMKSSMSTGGVNGSAVRVGRSVETYTPMNQREKGIGEADYAVTDGRWIYTLSSKKKQYTVHIFQPDGKKTQEVQNILVPLPKDREGKRYKLYSSPIWEEYNAELYVSGNILTVVEEIQGILEWDIKTAAYFYDISDMEHPKEIRHTIQNGNYNTLREYNGILYLVTQQAKVPVTAMKEENKDRYIPGLDGELLGTQNIILPPDSDGNAYTMVSSWKLSGDVQRQDVKAVIGRYLDVYMTENNLYLSTTLYADTDKKEKYDQTRIVKLQLYQGRLIGDKTETMQGTITSSFGIQEREDKLYVITQILHYKYEDDPDIIGNVIGSTEVCAYAFDENFRLLSKQKNIAKDENIKAVRFWDQMGYVVTYQQQDPLFSIDFSDPKNLKVMDKIEMPGFSGYLHPVKDDLLLGIGEAEDGKARISLYDISDNNKLSIYDEKEIDHIQYNNVLEDYRKIFVDEENNIAGFGGTDYGDSDDRTGKNSVQNYYVLYHYDRTGKLQPIGEYPVKKEYWGYINQKFIGMRIGTWFYVIPEETARREDMEIVPYS